jgi:hypothetical protein
MQKDFGEKPAVMMVEDIGNDDDLQKPQVKKDYSGVAAKTDPAEIALVKKLDRWIMPMLWSMYWLNYLDRNAIALARLNDLEEDLNLTPTRMSKLPITTNKHSTNHIQSTLPVSAFCSSVTFSDRSLR